MLGCCPAPASCFVFVAPTTTPSACLPAAVAFFGGDGHIPLYSLRSRDTIGALKMNGSVRSGVFSPDGERLLTSGGDGIGGFILGLCC